MALKKGVDVKPASGKLGILLPGMGAVATTFMAGVMAIRRAIGKPIGSLTQMGHIRLGKRSDNTSPAIKDYVSLAKLDDIVFGGWDIFEDDCYAAARTAGVIEGTTGSPTSTFSYNVTLQNQGQENLTVNLSADSNNLFTVNYSYNGQNVTSLPMNANDSKSLSVSATALGTIQGGSYPIKLIANGGSTQTTLDLTAQVTGQVTLSITTPSGTLSGNINSGSSNAVKLDVQNNGSAPANRIALTATSPTGWTVTFDPATIPQLAPSQQLEVTMNVTPANDAVAGDYMLSITGTPAESAATTIQFRTTVLTSTLWGVVGVVIIAIAVGVVALAVMRFGRR